MFNYVRAKDVTSKFSLDDESFRIRGIYGVYCSGNGLWYVGQSLNIAKRIRRHLTQLKYRRHFNKRLQRAFDFYGVRHFSFFLLCECDVSKSNEMEILWISRLEAFTNGFNLLTGGCGGAFHAEETKAKISKSLTGKTRPAFSSSWRRQMSISQRGRTQTEEVKLKISASLKGRVFTDEWRLKISIGKKARFAKKQVKNV